MIDSVFAALTSFTISLILLPFIIRFSKKKNLGATPGGRRIHKEITPSLGGVAIFLGFVIATILWSEASHQLYLLELLGVLTIPFIIGLLDDMIHLKPLMKILGQAVAATLIFLVLDAKLISFYGLFAIGEIHPVISYLITLFFVIVVTNSFNLIDGIDGLAATFSMIALFFFGMWFYFAEVYQYTIVCMALCGAVLAFLFQNWEPSRIFMGDTGSLIIGTVLSILTIEFLNYNYDLPQTSDMRFQDSIGTALCIMILPLVDTTRVIIIRLYNGVSPLTPDKRHIHHILVRLGKSHRLAVSILCIIHIFFIATAIMLRKVTDPWVLIIMSITAATLCIILDRFIYRYTLNKKE